MQDTFPNTFSQAAIFTGYIPNCSTKPILAAGPPLQLTVPQKANPSFQLWKLYIWEVVTWEIVTWEVTIGKI